MEEIILAFLKQGQLGTIKNGMSLDEVRNTLKIPSNHFFQATNTRIICEVDDLTLSFGKRKLDIISVNVSGNKIKLPSRIFEQELHMHITEYEKVIKYFHDMKIRFEKNDSESHEAIICLELFSEVLVYFDSNNLRKIVSMQL